MSPGKVWGAIVSLRGRQVGRLLAVALPEENRYQDPGVQTWPRLTLLVK
jgi:hypothetical protein